MVGTGPDSKVTAQQYGTLANTNQPNELGAGRSPFEELWPLSMTLTSSCDASRPISNATSFAPEWPRRSSSIPRRFGTFLHLVVRHLRQWSREEYRSTTGINAEKSRFA
jgi:hypothetical protein